MSISSPSTMLVPRVPWLHCQGHKRHRREGPTLMSLIFVEGIGATIMGISLFVGRLVTPFAETAFACAGCMSAFLLGLRQEHSPGT